MRRQGSPEPARLVTARRLKHPLPATQGHLPRSLELQGSWDLRTNPVEGWTGLLPRGCGLSGCVGLLPVFVAPESGVEGVFEACEGVDVAPAFAVADFAESCGA